MDGKPGKKNKPLHLVILIVILLLLSVGIIIIFNFQTIKDQILASSFEPSEEIGEIEENLELTNKGRTIFFASSPSIDGESSLKADCPSPNNVVTLGCFQDGKIHISKTDLTASEGLAETTSAHELLHAIWFRLDEKTQDELLTELEDFYESTSSEFKKTLDPYSNEEFSEELYVRSAIQLEKLPEKLETHYEEYFKNRRKIYDFYLKSRDYEKKTGRLIY